MPTRPRCLVTSSHSARICSSVTFLHARTTVGGSLDQSTRTAPVLAGLAARSIPAVSTQ